jgi:hypothetical protein
MVRQRPTSHRMLHMHMGAPLCAPVYAFDSPASLQRRQDRGRKDTLGTPQYRPGLPKGTINCHSLTADRDCLPEQKQIRA